MNYRNTFAALLFCFGFLLILFSANSLLRVSYNENDSIGIIEHLIWGKPLKYAISPKLETEEATLFQTNSIKLSQIDEHLGIVLDKIIEIGIDSLVNNSQELALTSKSCSLAYYTAISIDNRFLEKKYFNYPKKQKSIYQDDFLPALGLLNKGFSLHNADTISVGYQRLMDYYFKTLAYWIGSQN